jgi:hypothetical protein
MALFMPKGSNLHGDYFWVKFFVQKTFPKSTALWQSALTWTDVSFYFMPGVGHHYNLWIKFLM